jgi:hypothetical protein
MYSFLLLSTPMAFLITPIKTLLWSSRSESGPMPLPPVPGNSQQGFESPAMKEAAATWGPGDWWKLGGGRVWDAIVYDPVDDLLVFGTGTGSPQNEMYRDPSGGDDLFLASIVAVRPETGAYVWHYQTTPGSHARHLQQQGAVVQALEHADDGLLHRGSRGGVASLRQARDSQQ